MSTTLYDALQLADHKADPLHGVLKKERRLREQRYLTALEKLAAVAREHGNAAEAERLLRLAVAADPLRESAQRALMQALASAPKPPAST